MTLSTAILIGFIVTITVVNFALWFHFVRKNGRDARDEKRYIGDV